jgi:hypothetical protein
MQATLPSAPLAFLDSRDLPPREARRGELAANGHFLRVFVAVME